MSAALAAPIALAITPASPMECRVTYQLMRETYREDLRTVTERLVLMSRQAGAAMSAATEALLGADARGATDVIGADAEIDDLRDELDERVIDLLARQQPVASELRTVVAALRMADDIERMGDLAKHVAKIVLLRAPQAAVPTLVRDDIAAMGAVARRQADALATTIAHHDEAGATRLDTADDAMDVLHRRLFDVIAGPAWTYPVHVAIDVALTSRYLERFADHAVTAARRVHFLVTGSYGPECPADR